MQTLDAQVTSGTKIPASEPVDGAPPPLLPRAKVRAELTRLLIASLLCDADFPNIETLPRVAEIPYAHLDHQVLLDYEHFAKEVWAVVRLIQSRVSVARVRVAQIASFLVAIAGAVVAVSIFGDSENFGWPIFFSAVIPAGIVYTLLRPNATKRSAWARTTALKLLLEGKNLQNDNADFPIAASWGNGDPSGQVPVLVTKETSAFPGFGRWQVVQLFVCPPEASAKSRQPSSPELFQSVFDAAKREVNESNVQNVETGRVVVVHEKTLRKDSGWLKDGRPRLFLNVSEYERFDQIDPDASARAYGMIQALLPEHLGIITFFLRTFFAGNSASVEISLCTLGPPISSRFDIQKKIRQYDEYRRPPLLKLWTEWKDRQQPKTSLGAQLRRIRKSYQESAKRFQNPKNPLLVARLAPHDRREKKEADREIPKLASAGDAWLGTDVRPRDLRDLFSLSVTKDYFGNKECIATIRTLYDRIGKAVLKEFENQGYSIEEYKSDQGRLILNAERIGQLVVAERISAPITHEGPKHKKTANPQPS